MVLSGHREPAVPSELTSLHLAYRSLHCRLRGLAVCRSWLSALSDLPIRKVSLSDYDVAFCRWIIKTQPSVLELHLLSTLDVAVQALSSVQHKVSLWQLWPTVGGSRVAGLTTLAELPCGVVLLERVSPIVKHQGVQCLPYVNALAS